MRKLTYTLLFFLAAAQAAQPQGLTLPKEVSGKPGQFIPVKALTQSKQVEWTSLTPGLSVFPSTLLKDGRTTVVLATSPGSYHLLAVVWSDSEKRSGCVARCVIVVSGKPLPPEPNPPNPFPPDPDPPKPTPEPTDPLFQVIKTAWQEDSRNPIVTKLAEIYEFAATEALSEKYKTLKQLISATNQVCQKLGVSGKLKAIPVALAKHFVKELPPTSQEFNQDRRALVNSEFTRVAKLLRALK